MAAMCGRFTQTATGEVLVERFGLEPPPDLIPRYNIAPGQPVLVILDSGDVRAMRYLRWGLVPSWAKDQSIGYRMINARAETLAEKPAFRGLIKRRRCLVIADGFYEWRKVAGGRFPVRFVLRSREPFAFAGLWDEWRPTGDGPPLATCTIITVAANTLVAPIHDRMPAILRREDEERWIDPKAAWEGLAPLIRPYDPQEMEAYPVRRIVNSPAHDGPACIEPAPDDHPEPLPGWHGAPAPGLAGTGTSEP